MTPLHYRRLMDALVILAWMGLCIAMWLRK